MHIFLVSPTPILPGGAWGGVSSHTEMLVRALKVDGHRVTLLTSAPDGGMPEGGIDGIRMVGLPHVGGNDLSEEWDRTLTDTSLEIHKEDPADLILSQGHWSRALLSQKEFCDVPTISFAHNFALVHLFNNWQEVQSLRNLAGYFWHTIPRLIARIVEEAGFWRKCRGVISVSHNNAAYLRRFYRIPPGRLHVLHHWLPDGTFAQDTSARAAWRTQHGIPGGSIVFLMAGSLWRPKGCHTAIRAFHDVAAQIPDARLVLVGGGRDEARLKGLAEKLSLSGKVLFTGPRPREELPVLYNAADVFLLPSLLSEGLSYSLIEAMTCGLPVIATRRGGNIETVGKAGRLVAPGDTEVLTRAMLDMGRSPELRRELSEQALRRARKLFSEEIGRKALREIIEVCLPAGKNTP